MTKRFRPAKYLDSHDLALLRQTKANIKKARSKRELNYYESILDSLMKKAILKFRAEEQNYGKNP
ncbi:hypothetical protein [Bacillus sp. 2205SS5-2]|uniref:hypothetical protein n=1 Tax=Bacillus sp. 2205SS5-2 TaxID=3109031 RepID=UPI003005BC9E